MTAYRMLYPDPPDLIGAEYVTATFDFREQSELLPAMQCSTSSPSVLRALAEVLATGRNDDHCRCTHLATVTLIKHDGEKFKFRVMPAHGDQDCQLDVGGSRYAVDRQKFLAATAALGMPPKRWIGP